MASKGQAAATASGAAGAAATTADPPATVDVTYVGSSPAGVEVKLSTGWQHVDHGETVAVASADATALLEQGEEQWVLATPAAATEPTSS